MTRQDAFELAMEAKTGTPKQKIKDQRCSAGFYTTAQLRDAYYWYVTGYWAGFLKCENMALAGAYD